MSRVCEVTGKRPAVGNTVSHANNKKKRRFLPNLHEQRFWLEDERRWIKLRLSTRALRTIEKNGIDAVVAKLRAAGHELCEGAAVMREKGQTAVLGQHRPLLRGDEEQAPAPGEARDQEVRSGRAQARDVQGNEDQVSGPLQAGLVRKEPQHGGFFAFGDNSNPAPDRGMLFVTHA